MLWRKGGLEAACDTANEQSGPSVDDGAEIVNKEKELMCNFFFLGSSSSCSSSCSEIWGSVGERGAPKIEFDLRQCNLRENRDEFGLILMGFEDGTISKVGFEWRSKGLTAVQLLMPKCLMEKQGGNSDELSVIPRVDPWREGKILFF